MGRVFVAEAPSEADIRQPRLERLDLLYRARRATRSPRVTPLARASHRSVALSAVSRRPRSRETENVISHGGVLRALLRRRRSCLERDAAPLRLLQRGGERLALLRQRLGLARCLPGELTATCGRLRRCSQRPAGGHCRRGARRIDRRFSIRRVGVGILPVFFPRRTLRYGRERVGGGARGRVPGRHHGRRLRPDGQVGHPHARSPRRPNT